MSIKGIDFIPGYNYEVYDSDKFDSVIDRIIKDLVTTFEPGEFNTIIGCGLSGSLVVPEVARRLDVFWAIVRKPGEHSHHSRHIAGKIGTKWIFLDDLIETGATLDHTIEVVEKEVSNWKGFSTEMVGKYCYIDY